LETPNYIKALLIPNGHKPKGRKVWSIDLETVWLPFFISTNVTGETNINPDALGAPLRLAYDADGTVKFSKTGRPVVKVVKELSDNIRLVRENFTAGLTNYANSVITDNPDGYKEQVETAREDGEPIIRKDNDKLQQAVAKQIEQELAKAQAQEFAKAQAQKPKETPKPKEKVLATA
jgi:septum formation inhibitor MinC